MLFVNQRLSRYGRILAIPLLLFLAWILWVIRLQSVFETSLDSLFISFNDFEPSYTEALKAAGPDYFDFDFSTLPERKHAASNVIPPIIHFIWFKNLYGDHLDVSAIPREGSDAPKWCTEHNPGVEVNIWNATAARELLETEYAWFLPTYDSYRHPIQRVDAIKYFILWHYGGIYLDLDVSCRKSLHPLFEYPAWFPRASPLGVNNDIMASRAGHPLMWRMVDSLRERNKNLLFPWVTIFWTTGPKFTSDILQEYLYQHGTYGASQGDVPFDKASDANAVYVLPREFYSEEFTFFGHMPGGTWHGGDVAVILWIVDHPWILLLIPTAAVLLVVVWRLRKRRRGGTVRSDHVDSHSLLLHDVSNA